MNISNNKNAINEELRDKWVLMEKKTFNNQNQINDNNNLIIFFVLSVEPSSRTNMFTFTPFCLIMLSICSDKYFSPLYVDINTVTVLILRPLPVYVRGILLQKLHKSLFF